VNTPWLWFLNRGAGLVLLPLFTLTVLLGIASTRRRAGSSRWSGLLLSQGLHRSVSLVTFLVLGVHIASAVVDDYVSIEWWHAIVPFGGQVRPTSLGLGALAVDLTVVAAGAALLRRRLSERAWLWLHRAAYPSWVAALAHTIGMGTDVRQRWLQVAVLAAAVLPAAALGLRHALRSQATRPVGPAVGAEPAGSSAGPRRLVEATRSGAMEP